MKKTFLILAAAFMMAACGKTSPTDRVIEVMNEYAPKIENAASMDEIEKLSKEMGSELEQIKKDNPDWEPTKEDQQRIMKAAMPLMQAAMKGGAAAAAPALQQGIDKAEEALQDLQDVSD